jgi:hypothetical protein
MNLKDLLNRAGIRNEIEDAVEKKRQEMAATMTRMVINEALKEAKARAEERDRLIIKPDGAEKK